MKAKAPVIASEGEVPGFESIDLRGIEEVGPSVRGKVEVLKSRNMIAA